MPGCVLHISGEEFQVNVFLEKSELQPYRVYHKGDIDYRSRHLSRNGLSIDISAVDGDLKEEIEDAIRFLSAHDTELMRLRSFPGVVDMRLDFGYYHRDVALQCEYLPADLLALAGKLGIGIELSLYPLPK